MNIRRTPKTDVADALAMSLAFMKKKNYRRSWWYNLIKRLVWLFWKPWEYKGVALSWRLPRDYPDSGLVCKKALYLYCLERLSITGKVIE